MPHRRSIFIDASGDRLQKLISLRIRHPDRREEIDQRIWDLFGEEWCVMFTDLSGFSRNSKKFGIVHFLETIHECEQIVVPIIDDFDGILLKTEGDSLLVVFRNAVKAVHASIEMQEALAKYNKGKDEEGKVLLCLGLGYGRMLKIGDADVFGAEVNAASKLGEDIAKAGEILVTRALKERFENMYASGTPEIGHPVTFEPISGPIPGADTAYQLIYTYES